MVSGVPNPQRRAIESIEAALVSSAFWARSTRARST
jgi:hypothetical protein